MPGAWRGNHRYQCVKSMFTVWKLHGLNTFESWTHALSSATSHSPSWSKWWRWISLVAPLCKRGMACDVLSHRFECTSVQRHVRYNYLYMHKGAEGTLVIVIMVIEHTTLGVSYWFLCVRLVAPPTVSLLCLMDTLLWHCHQTFFLWYKFNSLLKLTWVIISNMQSNDIFAAWFQSPNDIELVDI